MRRGVASVAQWVQVKRRLRNADARDIRSGRKSEAQVKRENSHFVARGSVRLVFDPARV